MYILGINCFLHDASAALLKDGQLVAASEEERFTRTKHDGGLPVNSIKFCLEREQIRFNDIDHLGIYFNPRLTLFGCLRHAIRYFPTSLPYAFGMAYLSYRIKMIPAMLRLAFDLDSSSMPSIYFVDHHVAHAASSFFLSPFDDAAILTMDGSGEIDSTVYFRGKDNHIQVLHRIKFPDSLGMVYSSVTKYLGFKPDNGEYKVMGLSSYGTPSYLDTFREIIKSRGDEYSIDLSYFDYWARTKSKQWYGEKFAKVFGLPRLPGKKIEQYHMDVAASLQTRLEEVALSMARSLQERTGAKKLCLAGGVGLNCVMNGKIVKSKLFDEVFIQPASHDAGTSVGAALYVHYTILGNRKRFVLKDVSLGPEYSNDEIEKILDFCKLKQVQYLDDVVPVTAKLLAEGNIVGWFQGRMEFGPRALGSRSILADPTRPDMKEKVNMCVKKREDFRPFAPSVREESVNDYFNALQPSPYMLIVYDILEEKRAKIPAITHVDGTGRVQTVNRESNPLYHRLIMEFEKLQGVPMVLNTSFNVRGEPIVCTPEDAIRCFMSTGLDYLVLGNYLVEK